MRCSRRFPCYLKTICYIFEDVKPHTGVAFPPCNPMTARTQTFLSSISVAKYSKPQVLAHANCYNNTKAARRFTGMVYVSNKGFYEIQPSLLNFHRNVTNYHARYARLSLTRVASLQSEGGHETQNAKTFATSCCPITGRCFRMLRTV